MEAMQADFLKQTKFSLRVDGGMTENNWVVQNLADQLNTTVDRSQVTETTAMGAAYLAGLQCGLCPGPKEFAENWRLDRRFTPQIAASDRDRLYSGWRDAVRRTLTNSEY